MRHQASVYIASSLDITVLPPEQQFPNIDVEHVIEQNLTIGSVRRIIESAYRVPLAGSSKHIVIVANTLTREAQNALLKVLEEPPHTTYFALLVPSVSRLLPTILSRVQLVTPSTEGGETSNSFLCMSYVDRLAFIQKAAKEKEYTALHAALAECARWLHTSSARVSDRVYEVVNMAVLRAQEPGASLKMLCEQVAIECPIVTNE